MVRPTLAAGLAARVTGFTAKLTTTAARLASGAKAAAGAAKCLRIIASTVEAFRTAITALNKIGRGLHKAIGELVETAANQTARVVRSLNQYKVEINPNTLGMNGGNIRIVRKNPRTRIPRKHGRWDGKPGNGTWYPDNSDARSVLGKDGVPFKDGRPDFSKWSKGELEFEPGVLDGSPQDFNRVYEQVKDAKGLSSNNAAKEYLKDMGLTPHHHSDTVIQLIPTKLHRNVPHIGSASDMRSNF